MSYYSEQGSHIKDKVKVVLVKSKKELDHAISVDTSYLPAKKILLL